jgi:hypothetical protein
MLSLYQGTIKPAPSNNGWLIIVVVFIIAVLSIWQILDAVFPPPATSTTNMEKLRSDFNSKFGADRTTVREAEFYRPVTPSPAGAP